MSCKRRKRKQLEGKEKRNWRPAIIKGGLATPKKCMICGSEIGFIWRFLESEITLCENCWMVLWVRSNRTVYRRYWGVQVPTQRYETPEWIYGITVWKMALETMEKLGGDKDFIQLEDIRREIRKKYPRVKESTTDQEIRCRCINIPTRGAIRSTYGTTTWLNNPLFAWDLRGGFRLLTKGEIEIFKKAHVLGHPIVEKESYPIEELRDVGKELSKGEVCINLLRKLMGSH